MDLPHFGCCCGLNVLKSEPPKMGSLGGSTLMNGINVLKRLQRDPSSLPPGEADTVRIPQPKEGLHQTWPCWLPALGITVSGTVRNKFLLFEATQPVLFVLAAQQIKAAVKLKKTMKVAKSACVWDNRKVGLFLFFSQSDRICFGGG